MSSISGFLFTVFALASTLVYIIAHGTNAALLCTCELRKTNGAVCFFVLLLSTQCLTAFSCVFETAAFVKHAGFSASVENVYRCFEMVAVFHTKAACFFIISLHNFK